MALYFSFFFNDTATAEIYTLPLHDALPISGARRDHEDRHVAGARVLLQRAAEIEPIAVRHGDVEQDQAGQPVLQDRERRRRAGSDLRFDALQLEERSEESDYLRIVVHHQHAGAGGLSQRGAHSFSSVPKRSSLVSLLSTFGPRS